MTLVFLLLTALPLATVAAAASPVASPGDTIVVTSSADDGPGTLRRALKEAQSGNTITFDPTVFPPTVPVTISVTSALPHIRVSDLTIDASNAGVILDGRSGPGIGWLACRLCRPMETGSGGFRCPTSLARGMPSAVMLDSM